MDTIKKLNELNEILADRRILLGELRRSQAGDFQTHIVEQIKSMTDHITKMAKELLSEGLFA